MLNFWNYFLIFLSATTLFFLLNISNPLKCLFLAELNWVSFILNSFLFASTNNEPRFLLISFIFLFIAAIEIVLYIANFTYKK